MVVKECLLYIARCKNVEKFKGCDGVFTVVNTYSHKRSGIAKIELICDEEYMAKYKITTVMTIPESAHESIQHEKINMVPKNQRVSKRSSKTKDMEIVTFITLEKHAKSLKVNTLFENIVKDHRFRVIVPTEMNTTTHKAESVFELAKFRYPLLCVQNFECTKNLDWNSKIRWNGNMLRLTSLKCAQKKR